MKKVLYLECSYGGLPLGRGGMVINWYQLIQSQESIQIIIVCINFIELLEWFKGTSLTSPESLNYDTLVGASFHDTRQTASLHCEALCRPCFDISFRKTVSLLAFKRILPALTLQQPNSPQNHSIVILSLELLFMTRNRQLRWILKLCASPASTFPSEKRFHLWHSREFFQL